MSGAKGWDRAFAIQAEADLQTYKCLQGHRDVPMCHKLHFLQMACEKLCKAHLCKAGSDPVALQSSHRYIGKNLPVVVKQQLARLDRKVVGRDGYPMNQIRQLAREIELLSPAVDDNKKRPENCEYPWQVSPGEIRTPLEYQFPNLNLLTAPSGRTLLKCVWQAIAELT